MPNEWKREGQCVYGEYEGLLWRTEVRPIFRGEPKVNEIPDLGNIAVLMHAAPRLKAIVEEMIGKWSEISDEQLEHRSKYIGGEHGDDMRNVLAARSLLKEINNA